MTRMDILLTFAKKSVFPVLFAVILYNLFFQLAVQYGTVNYIYLLMLCGIPFGIRFMFLLPMFFGNLGTGIAMGCFNIAAGALIGGFVLLWRGCFHASPYFFEWTFSAFYVILLKMSFRGT